MDRRASGSRRPFTLRLRSEDGTSREITSSFAAPSRQTSHSSLHEPRHGQGPSLQAQGRHGHHDTALRTPLDLGDSPLSVPPELRAREQVPSSTPLSPSSGASCGTSLVPSGIGTSAAFATTADSSISGSTRAAGAHAEAKLRAHTGRDSSIEKDRISEAFRDLEVPKSDAEVERELLDRWTARSGSEPGSGSAKSNMNENPDAHDTWKRGAKAAEGMENIFEIDMGLEDEDEESWPPIKTTRSQTFVERHKRGQSQKRTYAPFLVEMASKRSVCKCLEGARGMRLVYMLFMAVGISTVMYFMYIGALTAVPLFTDNTIDVTQVDNSEKGTENIDAFSVDTPISTPEQGTLAKAHQSEYPLTEPTSAPSKSPTLSLRKPAPAKHPPIAVTKTPTQPPSFPMPHIHDAPPPAKTGTGLSLPKTDSVADVDHQPVSETGSINETGKHEESPAFAIPHVYNPATTGKEPTSSMPTTDQPVGSDSNFNAETPNRQDQLDKSKQEDQSTWTQDNTNHAEHDYPLLVTGEGHEHQNKIDIEQVNQSQNQQNDPGQDEDQQGHVDPELAAFLKKVRLSKYEDNLFEIGVESVEDLQLLVDQEVSELYDIGMKKVHVLRLRQAFVVLKSMPSPTEEPTARPTNKPTLKPTLKPTTRPTRKPTSKPTRKPTSKPTLKPTMNPTMNPTNNPTPIPTPFVTEQSSSEGMTDHTSDLRNSIELDLSPAPDRTTENQTGNENIPRDSSELTPPLSVQNSVRTGEDNQKENFVDEGQQKSSLKDVPVESITPETKTISTEERVNLKPRTSENSASNPASTGHV